MFILFLFYLLYCRRTLLKATVYNYVLVLLTKFWCSISNRIVLWFTLIAFTFHSRFRSSPVQPRSRCSDDHIVPWRAVHETSKADDPPTDHSQSHRRLCQLKRKDERKNCCQDITLLHYHVHVQCLPGYTPGNVDTPWAAGVERGLCCCCWE